MDNKVSIIVPIYNVEQYLRECIDSLVHQTYQNIEILLVHDGSKDRSDLIMEEYKQKYPHIVKTFYKENGGLADARNYGLQYATGDYVCFVDSDDYVDTAMVEELLKKATETGADVVIADLTFYYEDHSRPSFVSKALNTSFGVDIHKAVFMSAMYACSKIYRRSLFTEHQLQYPKGLWYEDIPVTSMIFALADKIAYLDKPLYFYRQREGSIMNSKYDPRMYHIFDILDLAKENVLKTGKLQQYQKEFEYLIIEQCMLYGIFRFLRCEKWKDLSDKAFDYMNQYYPDWRKNPYISRLGIKKSSFLAYDFQNYCTIISYLFKGITCQK